MSDNITLPRDVVQEALAALEHARRVFGGYSNEIEALRTALAAEQPASEPVESDDDEEFTRERVTTLLLEVMDWTYTQAHRNRPMTEAEQKVLADIRTALAAEQPKQEPVAYFDLQKQVFYWAKPTMIDVPMIVALKPLPLYGASPAAAPEPVRYPEKRPALEVYNEIAATDDPGSPLERLRFFCSLAMRPQDWLDVEPFFDSLREPVRHPGYIIGNHWLETAYERLCAGEAEDAILEDYELVREPRLRDLRRNAERYKWALGWLVRTGLLSCEACRIDSPASYGNWWILRKPRSIDGGSFVAFGADLKDAIDAAMDASTAPTAAAVDAPKAPEAKP